MQISNFIRSWELPKAIELIDGVDFKPSYLDVKSDYLALGGHVTMSPAVESSIQSSATAILTEYAHRAQTEFDNMSDYDIKNIKSIKLESVEWLKEQTKNFSIINQQVSSKGKHPPPAGNFDKNISLLFNDKPINYVAKKEFSIRENSHSQIELGRFLKAEAGWWLKVHNISGGISPGSVWIKATPDIGGYVRVCHFDIDPKNFGEWKCYGPAVQIILKNARFSVSPSFESNGVYLRGKFYSDGIEVRIPGWPSWASDLLAWVTRTLSDPIIDFLGALLSLFRVRVVNYPKYFPGTGLEWEPNLNHVPDNIGPYLEFSADPAFE